MGKATITRIMIDGRWPTDKPGIRREASELGDLCQPDDTFARYVVVVATYIYVCVCMRTGRPVNPYLFARKITYHLVRRRAQLLLTLL